MLVVRVSIRLSFVRPSVFPGDSLRKFTKLCVCMDIMETWFAIVDRQISSNFDRGICPLHDYGRYYSFTLLFFSTFTRLPNKLFGVARKKLSRFTKPETHIYLFGLQVQTFYVHTAKIWLVCAVLVAHSLFSTCYCVSSRKHTYIILTPLNPHLYSKTGVYRSIHYFSYFCPKHRLWVLVRTASLRRF